MSQQDNANSLKTSKVALRDSNDMRAISLVTMFFLPGTFMAVSGNLNGYYGCSQYAIDLVQYWFL